MQQAAMLVILPDDKDGIDTLEKPITADMIKKWQENLHSTEVMATAKIYDVDTLN